ncbi:MAG: DUF63 family protein [Candidatus Aenigmarchaeota archaeon]|nr:DUF63 family protein [Candidatus Aenigmarchaeota archaeon]
MEESIRNFVDWCFYSNLGKGYNVCNTLVYSFILIASLFFIFRFLKRVKVKVDGELALSVIPFVILGSVTRVLRDASILTSWLFVSPFIYLTVFLIYFVTFLIGLVISKKTGLSYSFIPIILGSLIVGTAIGFLPIKNLFPFVYVFLFFFPWFLIIVPMNWKVENKIILLNHLFDSTTTTIAVSLYGYYEQHPLPNFLIRNFTPVSFILFKLVVVSLVLILLDRFEENTEFRNFLKLVIGILGAATGMRDLLRMACMV